MRAGSTEPVGVRVRYPLTVSRASTSSVDDQRKGVHYQMSNYPPGVTGNEYEIAGADFEQELSRECPTCDEMRSGLLEGYRGERWWTCSVCGESVTMTLSPEDEFETHYGEED